MVIINLMVMDSDNFVNIGLLAYFNADQVTVRTTSNIKDLTIVLCRDKIDVVVMELFNLENDIYDCIEFIRIFPTRWPDSELIIYTQITHEDAVQLVIAVTGCKNIVFKNTNIFELAYRLVLSRQGHTHLLR